MYHSPGNRHILTQAQKLGLTVMFPLRSLSEALLAWDTAGQVNENDPTLLDSGHGDNGGGQGGDTLTYITEVEYRE